MYEEMLSELRMDQELRAQIEGVRGEGWGSESQSSSAGL